MKFILRNWMAIILILSSGALISAHIAEHFFNLPPCQMCLKQRYPYYAIILIIIFFVLLRQTKNILLFILNEFAILYGLFYAIWHVGI